MALSGTGTQESPFLITTIEELRTQVTDANSYYKLSNSLDTIGTQWESEWGSVTVKCKELDFNFKLIKNIKASSYFLNVDVASNAVTIKNLLMENSLYSSTSIFNLLNYVSPRVLILQHFSCSATFIGTTSNAFLCSIQDISIDDVSINLDNRGSITRIVNSTQDIKNMSMLLNGMGTFSTGIVAGGSNKLLENIYILGKFNFNYASRTSFSLFSGSNNYAKFCYCEAEITGIGTNPYSFKLFNTTTTALQASCFFSGSLLGQFSNVYTPIANCYYITPAQARSYSYLSSDVGFLTTQEEGA